jgi:signal transduction histidine kinase
MHLSRVASRVADTLDRVLFERMADIKAFAEDTTLLEGTAEQKRNRLEGYLKLYGYYTWLAATDRAGRVVAQTAPSLGGPTDVSELPWFRKLEETGEPSAEEITRSGHAVVAFMAPMYRPAGTFRGAVISYVAVSTLNSILEHEGRLRYSAPDRYGWLLLDRHGFILSEVTQAGMVEAVNFGRIPASFTAARGSIGTPGFIEEIDERHGRPLLTGYATMSGYGGFHGFDWTVLIRLDRAQAYAPIDRLLWIGMGVGLLVIAPLTGFGAWVSWRLVRESRALRETQEQLQRSVVELTRSNNDLQQFAYVASHDLQEPLRMVGSYTQLLARRYKGKLDKDADDFIGYAVEGAERMQKLIQDLLAYSRVNTQGKKFEPTNCNRVLEEALRNLRLLIEENHAVVTHDPLPIVKGDDTQLEQLFRNLIGNAIKFRGDAPPRVHVGVRSAGREWTFSVRDNGIGVDPQFADRIFVLFQRLHTRSRYPGTGIGLAVCKRIVERHGGRIWVDSDSQEGATFLFTIPMADGYLAAASRIST